MSQHNFVQVPVINKTDSLFVRTDTDFTIVSSEPCEQFLKLENTEPYIISVKTDGTCALICKDSEGMYHLMRRQDIKISGRNYQTVIDNGIVTTYAGRPCFVSKMNRGSGKSERVVPVYIFNLTPDFKPEIERVHIIGFTPVLHDFGDDKYAVTAIDGINGTEDVKLYTTVFNGSLDIAVESIPADIIMGKSQIMTVEIMGSKISDKYGFNTTQHFINPHGSIVYPSELAPRLDYESLKAWFTSDNINRWANVEGIVIHFPKSNRRFKLHRGHVGLEQTWKCKKSSGINFVFK